MTITDTYTPTIHAQNVRVGMVLNFEGDLAANEFGIFPINVAEVTAIEAPDGLGGWAFYVKPEESEVEVYVHVDARRGYPIEG